MKYATLDLLIPNPDKVMGLLIKGHLDNIYTWKTLPPQIDYDRPYANKAVKSDKWLRANLTKEAYNKLIDRIERRVEHYYGPEGAAQYDCLF